MSKTIDLTLGQVAIVDDGDFEKLNQFKWHALKQPETYYAARTPVGSRGKVFMHRELLNPPKDILTFHKNGNGLDNRRCNLELLIQTILSNNTTGYKGVCYNKQRGKYVAEVICKGERYFLGYFDDPRDAAVAYNKKAKELRGGYAYQNVLK